MQSQVYLSLVKSLTGLQRIYFSLTRMSLTYQNSVQAEETQGKTVIDPSLEGIVERMLERCCTDGQFEQGVGIALEARRLDLFEKVC